MSSIASPKLGLSEYFTIKQTARLLGRTEYAIWYHAKNLHPLPPKKGRQLFLTRQNLLELVEHMRLRDTENKDELILRVKEAVAE
jgi:hypothetical protein